MFTRPTSQTTLQDYRTNGILKPWNWIKIPKYRNLLRLPENQTQIVQVCPNVQSCTCVWRIKKTSPSYIKPLWLSRNSRTNCLRVSKCPDLYCVWQMKNFLQRPETSLAFQKIKTKLSKGVQMSSVWPENLEDQLLT